MDKRPLLPAVVALAVLLAGGATAQTVNRTWVTPGQTSSSEPSVDVEVTGSFLPEVIPAFPAPSNEVRVMGGRSGCSTQTYIVAGGQEVRVHRC